LRTRAPVSIQLRYLLPPGVLLLFAPLPELPLVLLFELLLALRFEALELLPEGFSALPELAAALEPASPPLLSLPAETESEAPSDLADDVAAGAELLRA
jgi:hypothetical protein